MYRVYFISSMYFVPRFVHAKVYETSIWTPCFQISAKTLPPPPPPRFNFWYSEGIWQWKLIQDLMKFLMWVIF